MAWHAPKTWKADDLVKQGDLNEQIRDNMNVLVVALDTATGKIRGIDTTTFANLDGTALTDVCRLASVNTLTNVNNFNGGPAARFIAPTGTDRYAT